jgi:CBS domain-containing protein
MKVKELMTPNAKACTADTNLAEAANLMWETDCGALPVVADGGKVIGVITDRDICMSAAINNRNLSNIAVQDVISGNVYSTAAEENVSKALKVMQDQRVRRLVVVDAEGRLKGILSLNDVVLRAQDGRSKLGQGIAHKDIVETLKAISAHRVQSKAAAG